MAWELMEKPFDEIQIDTERFDPNHAQQLLLKITNGLVFWYQKSGENRQKIIALGSKPKQDPTYDAINSERYDIDHKLEALKAKRDALVSVLSWKKAELRIMGGTV